MQTIHDTEGNELGSITLSEKQQRLLDAGENVIVIYHTPQLMHHLLGSRSGSFMLAKQGERVVSNTVAALKEFMEIQAGAAKAREKPDA